MEKMMGKQHPPGPASSRAMGCGDWILMVESCLMVRRMSRKMLLPLLFDEMVMEFIKTNVGMHADKT